MNSENAIENYVEKAINYKTVTFPPLPSVKDITMENFKGPHPESNKVVEGIYAGAHPGDCDDLTNTYFLTKILNCGVTKFVCLQHEYDANCTKKRWMQSGLRPYFEDVKNILDNKNEYQFLKTNAKHADFEHLPIKDMKTSDDYSIIKFAKKVVRDYYNGSKMYIHCWGGHGRTGVLVCIMLHLMYGLTADEALKYCELVHSKRDVIIYEISGYNNTKKIPITSPQTHEQFKQVRRIISKLTLNIDISPPIEHDNTSAFGSFL